jgi:hypothetical protein
VHQNSDASVANEVFLLPLRVDRPISGSEKETPMTTLRIRCADASYDFQACARALQQPQERCGNNAICYH